jgi:sialate O-acetylesterase
MKTSVLLGLAVAALANAEVRLPALISDHMLLQRGVPARIWGWANPGENVTVSFPFQKATAIADSAGKWQVFLKPIAQGGPADLTVAGSNTLTVHDVLVGEVWVASGQSNMEFRVAQADNAEQEIASANFPEIRLFLVKKLVSEKPMDDVQGSWVVCSPETVKAHSAVAYFFAREIVQKQHGPVGIIDSYWGGTPAQSWTSMPTLQADPALKFILDDWQTTMQNYPAAKQKYDEQLSNWNEAKAGPAPRQPLGTGHPNTPAGLYNGMIAPLVPYAVRGFLWYQGESNASPTHAYAYRRLFRTMIEDWRQAWGIGPLPFYFVQLANFTTNGWWPLLRESQTETLALRNTAMAVAIDVGNPKDIHPTDKQDVGHRLALAARAQVYGESIVYSGPMFREMTTEGPQVRVWFDSVGDGLASRGGGPLTGFEIAGSDGRFVPAEAKIDGDTVVVSSASVQQPASVRYGWADNPTSNLINKEQLPASPFRNKPGSER